MAYTDSYPIKNYKPFYIQRGSDTSALDTREQWWLVAKTNPYPVMPIPKEPYRNNWLDEDGDDEYIAPRTFFESFEMDVDFYIKSAAGAGDVRAKINAFTDAIRNGTFRVYDEYTGLGFRECRYAGFSEGEFLSRNNWARAIFTVTFKCNDPLSRIVIADNALVTPYNAIVTTAASTKAKQCTIAGFMLTEGVQVSLKFTHGNSNANPTLTIEGGDSNPIVGLPTSGMSTSLYYLLEYDGTNWNFKGYV